MSARYSITPAAAVDDKTLTDLQFRVLVTLGTYLGKSGEAAWPMQQTLADRIGCARESVVRALGVLEKRGYVKSQKAFKGRPGRHKAYLVNLEARFEVECDSSVTSECDSSVTSDVTPASLPNRTYPKNIPNRNIYSQFDILGQPENPEPDSWPMAAWDAYPHPANRGSRKSVLAKLAKIPIAERSRFERNLENYRDYLEIAQWQRPKMMATWLNQECWKTAIDLDQARKENAPNAGKNGQQPAGIVDFIRGEIAQIEPKAMGGMAGGMSPSGRGGRDQRQIEAMACRTGPRASVGVAGRIDAPDQHGPEIAGHGGDD